MVVPAVAASDASSIHGILPDANGRPWPAGPGREPRATAATPFVSRARTGGQRCGNVDGNERGHRADDEERGSPGGGPYACTGRSEPPQPSATRNALAAEWLAAALTSTIFCSDAIMAKDRTAPAP